MENNTLIIILLSLSGALFTTLLALVGWWAASMKESVKEAGSAMNKIADDVGSVKLCVVEYFTDLKNHKESTKEKFAEANEKFAETRTRFERIEEMLCGKVE